MGTNAQTHQYCLSIQSQVLNQRCLCSKQLDCLSAQRAAICCCLLEKASSPLLNSRRITDQDCDVQQIRSIQRATHPLIRPGQIVL